MAEKGSRKAINKMQVIERIAFRGLQIDGNISAQEVVIKLTVGGSPLTQTFIVQDAEDAEFLQNLSNILTDVLRGSVREYSKE